MHQQLTWRLCVILLAGPAAAWPSVSVTLAGTPSTDPAAVLDSRPRLPAMP
jgi:hypothetical protein